MIEIILVMRETWVQLLSMEEPSLRRALVAYLKYSLQKVMERGAWWASALWVSGIRHRVTSTCTSKVDIFCKLFIAIRSKSAVFITALLERVLLIF